MVFFMFGPSYDAWALGNEMWTAWSDNLNPGLKKLFEGSELSGDTIDWVSTAIDGKIYMPFFPRVLGYRGLYVNKSDGATSVYRTQDPTLLADTKPVALDTWGLQTRTVEHISFSSGGGWVVAYSDSTLRVSSTGTFPDSFHNSLEGLLKTRGCMDPQETTIKYVFFGAGDTFVVQMKNGPVKMFGIPSGLKDAIVEANGREQMLTKNTVLCPWDSRFYFAHFQPWDRWSTASGHFSWNIWPNGRLSDIVLREVLERQVPASFDAVVPFNQHPPPLGQSNGSAPAAASKPKPTSVPKSQTPKAAPPKPTAPAAKGSNPFRKAATKNNPTLNPRSVFSKEEIQIFETGFRQLETDGSGKMNADNAVQCLSSCAENIGGVTSDILGQLWDKVDKDNSGDLDFEEFLHAMALLENLRHGRTLNDDMTPSEAVKTEENLIDLPIDPPPAYSSSVPSTANDATSRAPVATREVNNILICDLCCSTITELAYSCNQCNDWDMCQRCHDSGKTCPGAHALTLTKIQLGVDLEDALSGMNLNGKTQGQNNPKNSGGGSGDSSNRENDDAQLKDSLTASIITEKPNVRWDDVAGLEAAKQELRSAVVLPIKFPELFSGQRKQRRGMLLYGPPGTGKSFLAKAIATEVESTLFSISASDVMSKWLGDSERLIKQLFKLAREKKPSIIFIDEIDALCGSRDAPGANPLTLGLKTELLVQMDGVGNDNEGVLLLGATNLPWTLDPAVRRRFQRKIHISLPDEKARRQLFKISAEKMEVPLGKTDYIELASMTDGFSGSDISNALQDALDVPIKTVQNAGFYRKVQEEGKELFTPCEESDGGAIKMTFIDVPRGKLKAPVVRREDIFAVLQDVKASVSQEEIKKCMEWTEQFGSEGA